MSGALWCALEHGSAFIGRHVVEIGGRIDKNSRRFQPAGVGEFRLNLGEGVWSSDRSIAVFSYLVQGCLGRELIKHAALRATKRLSPSSSNSRFPGEADMSRLVRPGQSVENDP